MITLDNFGVANSWAHRIHKGAKSSNGNLWFAGDTLYSYGEHYPVARWLRFEPNPLVLFASVQSSVTTECHKSHARRALVRRSVQRLEVPHVEWSTRANPCKEAIAHDENFMAFFDRAEDNIYSAMRRLNPDYKDRDIRDARETLYQAEDYAQFFDITYSSTRDIMERRFALSIEHGGNKKRAFAARDLWEREING